MKVWKTLRLVLIFFRDCSGLSEVNGGEFRDTLMKSMKMKAEEIVISN